MKSRCRDTETVCKFEKFWMFALHAKSYWNHVDNRNGGWERRRTRLVRKLSDTNDAGEDAYAPSARRGSILRLVFAVPSNSCFQSAPHQMLRHTGFICWDAKSGCCAIGT